MSARSRSTYDVSSMHEGSTVEIFMETTNLISMIETPKSARKRAPKSLPDLSQGPLNSLSDTSANLSPSSPSKLGELILAFGPDRAISEAPVLMRRLVEPCIIGRVNRLTYGSKPTVRSIDKDADALTEHDKAVLLTDFQTAMKHQMFGVVRACVKQFAHCDLGFLQQLCPQIIPVPILVAVYDLKARNSARKGKFHSITVSEDDFLCERCGFVKMAQCKECATVWCVNSECLDEKKMGEPVCLLESYCEKCKRPIQSNTFVSLKRGYCDCSEECCQHVFEQELFRLLHPANGHM